MSETVRTLELNGRQITLVGTAHVSKESVEEAALTVKEIHPDTVCIELDQGRWNSMKSGSSWANTDIVKIIKDGKAFFLLANLALGSFQRRMGSDSGIKPGEEMVAAIKAAEEENIPYVFCDRDIQITLRRAWAKSNLWNKCKLLAQLLAAAFSSEKPDKEEIERLKERSELDEMMGALASYLPSVKQVLIDERDRFLASKIWESNGNKIVAIIGAGHGNGIEEWLEKFAEEEKSKSKATTDVSDINFIPAKGFGSKILSWIIPVIIVALIVLGFFNSGAEASLKLILTWVLFNGSLAALGSLLCLAHPLTIIVSVLAAPISTLNPVLAVGFFAALCEASLRKPLVSDFQNLNNDVMSIKGFFKNKVTHILLVFFLSSLGGAIGNFISIPLLAKGAF